MVRGISSRGSGDPNLAAAYRDGSRHASPDCHSVGRGTLPNTFAHEHRNPRSNRVSDSDFASNQ